MVRALRTNVSNFVTVDRLVQANDKTNFNIDSYLWYFAGMSSFLAYHYTVSIPVMTKWSTRLLQVMKYQSRHSSSESSRYPSHTDVVKQTKIRTEY